MKYTANPVEVNAYEISHVYEADGGGHNLRFRHIVPASVDTFIPNEMTSRYVPVPGDYLVVESHGYRYLNPKEVFERKYSRVVHDTLPGLTEGRVVHYVLQNGQHRPAMVVRVWSPTSEDINSRGCVQLQVFLDGNNDSGAQGSSPDVSSDEGARGLAWRSSVTYSAEAHPNTWHWIEKV